ncbi:hypothetical protein GPECTOR_3g287 [Gonium pectorale]|uniref:SMP-LTD domain-containing protein n=1 Tax=Gonium pectorale TaxID=33097 RepID=A0A150GZ01_GONPE|nr:hypothetical protein GPECTOR_3g287 [Gonium pectorale]|eukprot:KXZ55136.1 hypothetical protein GPECTOR_3g287 [Gonium pectorale]
MGETLLPMPPDAAGSSEPVGVAPESLKGLPKAAAEAAQQAGKAYVSAGKEAHLTLTQLLSLRDKEGPPVTLTTDQGATAVFLLLVGLQLLILPIFMPSIFRLLYSLACGLAIGLGLSYMFYCNKKKKTEQNELLGINLGLKGVQLVAGGLPARFSASEAEKMEWLNTLIREVWPFVDKAVCQMIKDITAQTMPGVLASLPAGLSGLVKSISFKHLTFGAAPIRVENLWVSPDDKDSLVMEVSVKWCGDPNITLAIEIPGGQKLCPRIMDITFAATVRVTLNPLVPRMPGFVAAMATMPRPPLIKYRLDFGKALGGSLAPAAVTPVVNYFVRGVIDKMLVWPARIVVPILQETQQDNTEIQRLLRRHRGLLRVCVVRARQLRDVGDVQVQLTTDSEYCESTSIKHADPIAEGSTVAGDTVVFNEFIYLLVQEPKNQMLRLEAHQIKSLGGRAVIGRTLVKLHEVCKAGARGREEPVPMRVHLGTDDWGAPGGPGKGAGRVLLQMSYFPFENLTQEHVMEARKGIVTVRLLGIRGLTPVGTSLTTSVSISTVAEKLEGKSSWKGGRRTWTLQAYNNEMKMKVKQLEQARQRDLRDGKEAEAEQKARQIQDLNEAIAGNAKSSPVVKLDYTMDSSCLHAFYNVKEKVLDGETEEDNAIVVKVGRDGGNKADSVYRAEIPISEIRTAYDVNPMTGKREHGLHFRKWEQYNPEQPGVEADESEWGVPLEGTANAKVWLALRWVPCIEAVPEEQADEEEEAAAAVPVAPTEAAAL